MNNAQNVVLYAATNPDDAWSRLTLEPLRVGDLSYFDCSAARGGINVAGKLKTLLNLHSKTKKCAHLLLTGYRGDGKTTELFQLINTIQNQYRPLYFNAQEEFDLLDFKFPDFLLGIATVVSKRMDEEHLSLPDGLIGDVGNWFATIVQTVERKTSAEITAKASRTSFCPR